MCDICRQFPCHPRCPNYEQQKSDHYCSICDECIYPGENYIVNNDNEYSHWECVDYGRNLVEWLGYEIKTMDDN